MCGVSARVGLKTDESIVAWGDSDSGGDTQEKLITGANQIICGGTTCITRYAPGKFICQ